MEKLKEGYEDDMPRGPGKQLFATEEWAAALNKKINSEPRSYLSYLAGKCGCTRSTITKLRNFDVGISTWIEPISIEAGIALPEQPTSHTTRRMEHLLSTATPDELRKIERFIEVFLDKK